MTESSQKNQQFYRLCFRDIVAGFSIFEMGEKEYYAKHFSQLDLAELDFEGRQFEKEAVEKKLQTEKQKLKFLDETDNWTKKEEEHVDKLTKDIRANEKRISKIFLASQRVDFEKENKELKKEQEKLLIERSSLIGVTVESFVEKRKQEESFRRSIFLDSSFKQEAFSKEDYDSMEDRSYFDIISNYNFFMLRFSEQNLKKIAASAFFLNLFFLAKDSCHEFFGKRVVDLTFFQEYVFSKALFYKSVLTNPDKTTPDYQDDLDKFVNWLESSSSVPQPSKKSATAEKDTVASGLVGATKEELENYAASHGAKVISMGAEVRKMKKELGKDKLDAQDVLRLHDRLGI